MDDFGDDITSDDIDMLNSNDLLLSGPITSKQINSPNSIDTKSENLEDSFLIDTESKTPGEILDEFCMKLDDINTTMPNSVVDHYMKKAGFIVNDPKLVKIVSIASQKFISEIVNDVMQHHKLKTKSATFNAATAATGTATTNQTGAATTSTTTATGSTSKTNATTSEKSKSTGGDKASASAAGDKSQAPLTLTLEDLTQVLTDYGINVKKPYYFM